MELGVKLNPLTKLKLFHTARDYIFSRMDRKVITPNRADEILGYVKKHIADIETPERAKAFYLHLGEKFLELQAVSHKFELEEEEKIEKVLVLLIDEFMTRGDMELASEIMDQIKQAEIEQEKNIAEKLKNRYPIEFQRAMKKISTKFI